MGNFLLYLMYNALLLYLDMLKQSNHILPFHIQLSKYLLVHYRNNVFHTQIRLKNNKDKIEYENSGTGKKLHKDRHQRP